MQPSPWPAHSELVVSEQSRVPPRPLAAELAQQCLCDPSGGPAAFTMMQDPREDLHHRIASNTLKADRKRQAAFARATEQSRTSSIK